MTERERIEKLLTKYHEEIGGYEYQKAYLERQIRICEKQLAALPPDKPDLSAWRPDIKCEFYYIDELGDASFGTNYGGHMRDDDPNAYKTRAEAERAAKRQWLYTRLWQIHHHPKMYGAEGWEPEAHQYAWEVRRRNGFDDVYPARTVSGSVVSAPGDARAITKKIIRV